MKLRDRLLDDLAHLHRAEARARDDDVRAVRRDLMALVGSTVPRAASARALGVSQTALDRWVARGEVPVVITPAGRREVPTGALVELIASVRERTEAGERHPLAAALRDRRRREAAIARGHGGLIRAIDADAGHRRAELRGLAYHRALADRLDEAMIRAARDRLHRWRDEERIHPRYADRWEVLLSHPLPDIAAAIAADDDKTAALRQSSPFAGMLDERERERLLALPTITATP